MPLSCSNIGLSTLSDWLIGATSGVALAHFELHAWCLLVLGWVVVPFDGTSSVYTMPEFRSAASCRRRVDPVVISLVACVLTKIAVGIFAGGIVFSVLCQICGCILGH